MNDPNDDTPQYYRLAAVGVDVALEVARGDASDDGAIRLFTGLLDSTEIVARPTGMVQAL